MSSDEPAGRGDAGVIVAQLTQKALAIAHSGAAAPVYPSRYEGFGLPVLAAMACECLEILRGRLARQAGSAADGPLQNRLPRARAHAGKFSWSESASTISAVLLRTTRSTSPLATFSPR